MIEGKQYWLRSTLFNLAFYLTTTLCCVLALPMVVLSHDAFVHHVVERWERIVYCIERIVLGLDYEVRGKEHLPQDGPYLIAAKHQSPYETLKLHLLFKKPAIVLKQELLRIPMFGAYLQKADLIAIDRSTPDKAIASIQEGAVKAAKEGRAIVIFPQGTRVDPGVPASQKRYRVGIVRIQEATGLPIIPMALNCGMFWPRKGWLKHPGTAVFEFLPPIAPGGDRSETLQKLENVLEDASNSLRAEELQRRGRGDNPPDQSL